MSRATNLVLEIMKVTSLSLSLLRLTIESHYCSLHYIILIITDKRMQKSFSLAHPQFTWQWGTHPQGDCTRTKYNQYYYCCDHFLCLYIYYIMLYSMLPSMYSFTLHMYQLFDLFMILLPLFTRVLLSCFSWAGAWAEESHMKCGPHR